jgi:biopolymer transport protein ExbD
MAILRARAAGAGAGAGRGAPLPIVADHALEARKLVKIMRMVRQAGIEKIRLVTRKRAGQ